MESFTEIKRIMFPGQTDRVSAISMPEPCVMIIDDDLDIIEALTSLLQPRYRLISCHSFEGTQQNLKVSGQKFESFRVESFWSLARELLRLGRPNGEWLLQ